MALAILPLVPCVGNPARGFNFFAEDGAWLMISFMPAAVSLSYDSASGVAVMPCDAYVTDQIMLTRLVVV